MNFSELKENKIKYQKSFGEKYTKIISDWVAEPIFTIKNIKKGMTIGNNGDAFALNDPDEKGVLFFPFYLGDGDIEKIVVLRHKLTDTELQYIDEDNNGILYLKSIVMEAKKEASSLLKTSKLKIGFGRDKEILLDSTMGFELRLVFLCESAEIK